MTHVEDRVLVMAPWGRDAAVICKVLQDAGLPADECASLGTFVGALADGAGAAFVTEEALASPELGLLTDWLGAQPAWSDFPFVVLAGRHRGARPASAQAVLDRLGNVVLLERPLHAESLLSAARSALRGRRRQHEIRRHLHEQQRASVETARLLDAERQAKEATREVTRTLAFALNAAQLGTFHCPLPLDMVSWDPTCRGHFWLDPAGEEHIRIDHLYATMHGEDRDRVRAGIERAIEQREPYDIEFRTVSANGAFRWLRAKGMAYGPSGGQATRFDGITIDISVQKTLEAQREALLAAERVARLDAEHASRMKDEFLATLSHELRTPLAAIIGWTHVLRRAAANVPDTARAVDTIDRNARTQARLIDDLLDMSRITSGNLRLDADVVDLAVVTDAVLASLEPTAQAKRLRVDVKSTWREVPVLGDASRLQQVIWNLLSNAFKFTPAGGRVSVTLDRVGHAVTLTVQDSGQGIQPSFLPFVFDRFRQSDASTTRMHGGLGLGLAIVKNLVDLHGGTVQAHSDGPGTGARFQVRLPLADTAAPEAPSSASPAENGGAPSPCAVAGHDLAGWRILVVDDEPDLCELLQHELESCGATVYAVRSGAEATDVIEARRPDLLITDIGMPDEDGHALLRRVRALGASRGGALPAIALTAFAGPDDRARALASGFDLHVAKPVDIEQLLDHVAALLKVRQVASI